MNYANFVAFLMRCNAFIHGAILPMGMPEQLTTYDAMLRAVHYLDSAMMHRVGSLWLPATFTMHTTQTGLPSFLVDFTLPDTRTKLSVHGTISGYGQLVLYKLTVHRTCSVDCYEYNLTGTRFEDSLDDQHYKRLIVDVVKQMPTFGHHHSLSNERLALLHTFLKGE